MGLNVRAVRRIATTHGRARHGEPLSARMRARALVDREWRVVIGEWKSTPIRYSPVHYSLLFLPFIILIE
jgi:hypothetical protein